ncbi:MAG: hypothetical protein DSM106950_03540 [Stigonema ocellatum SAG 48.90 = DSM 106950]|nr:hypothetical protein [Stigonema ocellatum SAG 48.90 = DSM 106950]
MGNGEEKFLGLMVHAVHIECVGTTLSGLLPTPHSPLPTPYSPLPNPHSPLPTPHYTR